MTRIDEGKYGAIISVCDGFFARQKRGTGHLGIERPMRDQIRVMHMNIATDLVTMLIFTQDVEAVQKGAIGKKVRRLRIREDEVRGPSGSHTDFDHLDRPDMLHGYRYYSSISRRYGAVEYAVFHG